MTDAPLLTTARFDLWRPRAPNDLDGLCTLLDHEDTVRHLGAVPRGRQGQWERLLRNAGSWSLYGYGVFYVRPRGGDEIVASIGVFHSWRGLEPRMDDQPEAGWIVRHDHAGQGVAGEVLSVVLDWFDATHPAKRVVAMIDRDNVASQRVAARFGFAKYTEITDAEGTLIDLYERLPSTRA